MEGNPEFKEYNIDNRVLFQVHQRYQLVRPVGVGAFGVVCSAIDLSTGKNVAIKKIRRAFDNEDDTRRTLREIKLLKYFNHENILQIYEIQKPSDPTNFNDIYLVTELLETDLDKVIRSDQPLSQRHIQYFLFQIVCAVRYIHAANVIHRDLKPSNILVNGNCKIRICDFGMGRTAEAGVMTAYVATRWYRAPEIILTAQHYTKAIDTWSIGCILSELINKRPLFNGINYMHQVAQIISIIGTPSDDDLNQMGNEEGIQFIQSIGYHQRVNFADIHPSGTPEAISLLERFLLFNPTQRINCEDALDHPFFNGFTRDHEPPDPEPFNFDYENYQLTQDNYRQLFLMEALDYHPELFAYIDQNNV